MTAQVRWVALTLAAFLVACASTPQRTTPAEVPPKYQKYLQYAEAPTDRFTYLGQYDNWQAISDTQLVVWTTFDNAYLLTVREPCINLRFANRIALTNTANTVSNRLDSVIVGHDRCQITEIRPLDYKKMRADARNEHAPT
jgi:hypothetical protein